MRRRERGDAQQQAGRQPRTAGRGVGARRDEHEPVARRLAGESEQHQGLSVPVFGERQPHTQGLRHRAPRGVAQDRIGPRAYREPTLREPGEHDRREAQAAELERREHGDPVAAHAALLHGLAGEQLAQRLGGGAQVDGLSQHLEREQAGRDVLSRGGGLKREHRGDKPRETGRPVSPRAALRQVRGRSGQSQNGRLERARRAQPPARRAPGAPCRRRRRRAARPRPPRAARRSPLRLRRRSGTRSPHCSRPATMPASRASSSHSASSRRQ